MFRLERPRGAEIPVVVEVPHAGVGLPAEVRPALLVDAGVVRRDADSYVDDDLRAPGERQYDDLVVTGREGALAAGRQFQDAQARVRPARVVGVEV